MRSFEGKSNLAQQTDSWLAFCCIRRNASSGGDLPGIGVRAALQVCILIRLFLIRLYAFYMLPDTDDAREQHVLSFLFSLNALTVRAQPSRDSQDVSSSAGHGERAAKWVAMTDNDDSIEVSNARCEWWE